MSRIEWDESYSVNNPEIDEQHKKWIAIYNNIHDTLTGGDIAPLTNLTENSLEAMHDYACTHFNFEEEYMEQINFPDIVAHRRIHRDFENKIYRYTRDVKEGKTLLNTSLLKIIRNWLLEHILNEDKKYSAYAAQK